MKNPFPKRLPDGTTFDMIYVEGGSFMMGSEAKDAYKSEKPIHKVTLSSFYIGQYPVTQSLYKAVMQGQNPSHFKGDKRPVEQVSWFDAVVFCNVLNERCGFQICYFSDKNHQKPYGKAPNTEGGYFLPNEGEVYLKQNVEGYRLPTEAEWEYAARGGNQSGNYDYCGGDKINELGWFNDNSHGETKPVGLKWDNELGIYDMSGNVWEWCYDWYSDYNKTPTTNPTGVEKGQSRVLRGGGWSFNALYCRPAYRFYNTPTLRYSNIGFRLVLFSLSV